MKPLADETFWDDKYVGESPEDGEAKPPRPPSLLKRSVKAILGDRTHQYSYIVGKQWDDRYLGGREGQRVIEIGSAPGHYLVEVYRTYGLIPYGVEYTPAGAELNRQVFRRAGIDPDNVIEADFFDPAFHEQWDGQFDVVLSRGFIEHFDVLDDVIDKHVKMLRPGGLLYVGIPNFRGLFNYLAQSVMYRGLLDKHNLDLMDIDEFRRVFERDDLVESESGYLGAFSWSLFETEAPEGPRAKLLELLQRTELPLNVLFNTLYADGKFSHPALSSHLCWVGTRAKSNGSA